MFKNPLEAKPHNHAVKLKTVQKIFSGQKDSLEDLKKAKPR
jgi:hypothetical protein